MSWEREASRKNAEDEIEVVDKWAFTDFDLGRHVVINGDVVRKLYGGKKEHDRTNRKFLRDNADRTVKIVGFVGWRKDVARVEDVNGRIGYLRKNHLRGVGR